MKNYARIIDDIVVDISTDPDRCYHPLLAAQFEEVPENVTVRSIRKDGNWVIFDNQSVIPSEEKIPSVDFLAGVDSALDALLDLGVIEEKDLDDYRTDIINSKK